MVWRLTTAAIAAVLVIYGATCPLRRPAIVPDALPSRRWVAIACLSLVVIAALVGNVIGVPCRPNPAPIAVADELDARLRGPRLRARADTLLGG